MGFFDWLLGRKPAPAPEPAPDVPEPPGEVDIVAALDQVESRVTTGVPTSVTSRVHRVSQLIRETLPRVNSAGLQSLDTYSLMATATDYLPEALEGYLRLPREWADSRPLVRGKTALMVLIDQLDLLIATMDGIHDAVNRADAAALVAHGRFLQEKFGHRDELNLNRPDAEEQGTSNPLDL